MPFPNNPTGAVMEREDLEAVAEVLRGTNIMVLSDEIYAELNTCPDGLSGETAKKHAEQYGKNAIAEGKKTPVWMIFLEQFKDFLVIILIIAALISAFTGDLESFIVIIAVITMNAILGTVQTVKAEKSLSNLKKLSSPTAKVMRD